MTVSWKIVFHIYSPNVLNMIIGEKWDVYFVGAGGGGGDLGNVLEERSDWLIVFVFVCLFVCFFGPGYQFDNCDGL